MRIVSLLPSATEIVCALGAASDLVGTSHECDYPEEVQHLPRLTRPRVFLGEGSRAIDTSVRAMIGDALSIYAVDDALLSALAPDLILTQDLCEVCAVSLDDVRAAVARIANKDDVRVVSLSPTRLEHVLADVERVAEALGIEARGQHVRRGLEARLHALTQRASEADHRPRVVSIEWLDPIMLGGTWMPELIRRAGGLPVGAEDGGPAPTVTSEQLAALEPEVVLIKPCGFPLEQTERERSLVNDLIASVLPSSTRIYAADGNAYFNRSGPRLVESAEILAACIHPDRFDDLAAKHADAIVAWDVAE